MVVHSVTSKHSAEYGTHSHGEETFATPGGTVPAQLKWADLHPPGVKVLPKGAAPAGAGEINWEDTLGGKFALALEKLEGLLYAVFGSRPAAYPDGGSGYDKCQWYDRLHPRCLWAPETWERRLLMGPSGCTEAGECNDYQPVGKEYAALGENPPCCPMPRPTVPIRSRSGDPAKQYQQGEHDRSYFPLGSVARTADDAYPYDPTGKGWFGATQPGRTDVQPWLTAANGYTWEDGEPVVVSWVKPGGNTQVSNVRLYRQTKPPGSSWGGWGWSPMTWDGEKYTGTIGAQPHGTECRWYIRYYWDDPDPQIDPVTRYEPGGSSVPDAADAYYFQWYTHFNPYGHGL
ncbi:MAG: hypothetical protein MI702_11440, partial [Chlorobiales bacterium]|nr:hypothetical protein [Chlorobiales bacterium]